MGYGLKQRVFACSTRKTHHVNSPTWFVLIYKCDDADSQVALASELRSFGRLTVETAQSRDEHFVVIETDAELAALTVHELVMSIDPHAELFDTHDGSGSPRKDEIVRKQVSAQVEPIGG